jgi:hypothetical protein
MIVKQFTQECAADPATRRGCVLEIVCQDRSQRKRALRQAAERGGPAKMHELALACDDPRKGNTGSVRLPTRTAFPQCTSWRCCRTNLKRDAGGSARPLEMAGRKPSLSFPKPAAEPESFARSTDRLRGQPPETCCQEEGQHQGYNGGRENRRRGPVDRLGFFDPVQQSKYVSARSSERMSLRVECEPLPFGSGRIALPLRLIARHVCT